MIKEGQTEGLKKALYFFDPIRYDMLVVVEFARPTNVLFMLVGDLSRL